MERVVVINSIETIQEALVSKGNDFACRFSQFMMDYESHDGKGIIKKNYNSLSLHLPSVA